MGSLERRQRARDRVRQTLLDAAWELFLVLDSQDVTMRLIAEKAEYTPRTLYLYFKDKESLWGSVVEEAYRRTWESQKALGEALPTALLAASIHRHVREGLSHPRLYTSIFQYLWRPGIASGPYRTLVEESLADAFRRAGAHGVDARLLSVLLRAFTMTLICEGRGPDDPEADRRTQEFVHLIFRGTGLPPS